MIVGSLADALAEQGAADETDLELLRDAAPFHLKLAESVLSRNPGHLRLAESVAAGFTQYAYAFVAFEADQVEVRDVQAAEQLRHRAAGLYRRAHRHAMTALDLAQPGYTAALRQPPHAFDRPLKPELQGLAYWAAAAWGGWISLAKDEPDVVADLPLAILLAQKAWAVDPQWGQGALSGLLGVFEAARPGGSDLKALAYFDLAIAQSENQAAGPLVAKAEGYAQKIGDRALFESLLRQALGVREVAGSPWFVQNEVMRRRARWLLESADDMF